MFCCCVCKKKKLKRKKESLYICTHLTESLVSSAVMLGNKDKCFEGSLSISVYHITQTWKGKKCSELSTWKAKTCHCLNTFYSKRSLCVYRFEQQGDLSEEHNCILSQHLPPPPLHPQAHYRTSCSSIGIITTI